MTRAPDVLVIGGGPAGLGAATRLRAGGAGHVVVLERDGEAGGIPRQCGHSPFGMREFHRVLSGRAYARRLVAAALAAGVELRLRHAAVSIGDGMRVTATTPDGPIELHPRRILLATGLRETSRAGRLVSGDRPLGVITTGTLQDLVFLRHLVPFRRPIIVGSELVAMSAILTCRGAGIRPVALIEEQQHPVVRAPFSWLPRLLGIPVHFCARVTDIVGAPRVQYVSIEQGGAVQTIACDGVLFTGQFTPEASLACLSGLAIDTLTGGPGIDAAGRTTRPDIYAAGNLLRGVETAGWCWAEARAVADAMLADLAGPQPADAAAIAVVAGPGIARVVPQRLRPGAAGGLAAVQLRLDRAGAGRLVVRHAGRDIYARTLRSGPERRILIPLAHLPLRDLAGPLHVTFETANA